MSRKILKLSETIKVFDAIVIGAGAAGLFCAAQLRQKGKNAIVLEASDKIGTKILISGGGRCNFTNLEVSIKNFHGKNPNFVRSALSQFTNFDFIKLVEGAKIPYVEKTLGQLFVDRQGGASAILKMLTDACKGVKIKTGVEITAIEKTDNFKVITPEGEYLAKNIVIATGGKSIPKIGASGFAYDIAKQFGITVNEPAAALVPIVFSGQKYDWIKALSGVSCEAIVSCKTASFKEAILFTHKGMSGPAILQISSYINAGEEIWIDFTAGQDFEKQIQSTKQKHPNQIFINTLSALLPSRLAKELAGDLGERKLHSLKNNEITDFMARIKAFPLTPAGNEGYYKAEVTKGGIDTNELNQKTMESKKIAGLYFIGECIDVTGWLGGYNFQWAWSSAWACAHGISEETI
jgi:predicted Rossmann fold flavoprotein